MDAEERKAMIWRKAQADQRRLAQGYDVQAANVADVDPEQASELRALAAATRATAESLRPPDKAR